jgi:hypothetical protein
MTTMALFPPSSEQAAAEALRHHLPHALPHPGGTGGGDEGDAAVGHHALGHAVRAHAEIEHASEPVLLHHPVADVLHGHGGEGSLVRGLPDHGVAADGGDGRVPGPHRNREVEGGDDPHHAQRMPLLVHAVEGPLRVHGEAVELAGEADGEVADVDHLLHLAQALGEDLAHLQRDQLPQRLLVRAQLLPELTDDLPAPRCGEHAPVLEGRRCLLHHPLVVLLARRAHAGDGLAGGGVDRDQLRPVGLHPAPGGGPRVDGRQTQTVEQARNGDRFHEILQGRGFPDRAV